MQYQLRQGTSINTGGTGGTVIGKTADLICWFVGPTLYSRAFFMPSSADLNSVIFIDDNGVERQFPYASAGKFGHNAPLITGGTGYGTLYYATTPNGDDYGEGTAIIVKDKDGKEYNMVVVPKKEEPAMPKSSSLDSGERFRISSSGNAIIGHHVPEAMLTINQNKKPRKLNV
jgi:hypothetical protein